jgi:hypothetical protein
VTASQETDDLAPLEQTRARLESALSDDENWRALRQPSGPGEDKVARRARDARLEMALAENPAYRAWKHVNEAILALRPVGQGVAVKHTARPGPAPAAPVEAPDPGASELPKEIVDLIRAGAEDNAAAPQLQKQAPPSLSAAIARVHVPTPSVESQPPAAPGHAASGSPARTKPARPARAQAPAGRVPPPADWEEATVTFVTRDTRPPPLPRDESPAGSGLDPTSALSERLSRTEGALDANEETFAPPNVATEEAEVTILTPEDKEALRLAEERAGTVRRLRKAITGD